MNLLPISTPLVYWAELKLENLYNSELTKKIKITSNQSSNIPNSDTDYEVVSAGNFQAISFNKLLENSSTHFKDIPLNIISKDILLSRQLIGTKFQLLIQSSFPNLDKFPVMTGIIGSIDFTSMACDLELVLTNERLKTPNPYKISQDCMNTLGQEKCTLNDLSQSYFSSALTNKNTFSFADPTFIDEDSVDQYELEVGTTKFIIDKANSTSSSIVVVGKILGNPQIVTIRRHCNGTIGQCQKYENLTQFNGVPFLTSGTLNVNI